MSGTGDDQEAVSRKTDKRTKQKTDKDATVGDAVAAVFSRTRPDEEEISDIAKIERGNYRNLAGHEHSSSHNRLRMFALTNPKTYDTLRQKIEDDVKVSIGEMIYTAYWDLLDEGIYDNDQQILIGGKEWAPKIPRNEIKRYAAAAADAVSAVTSKIMDKVFPASFTEIVDKAYSLGGKSSMVKDALADL